MKICLFDDILERHVRKSLARALTCRGHEVFVTPPVWRGHSAPTKPADVTTVRSALEEVTAERPYVLFNFRASTLSPDMLRDLHCAGIVTIMWLPDDPVLYDISYKSIVDHYDLRLNCDSAAILQIYEKNRGIRGVNFPFWTDRQEVGGSSDAFTDAEFDLVFLSNVKGKVRTRRYDILACLSAPIRFFSRLEYDPADFGVGYLCTKSNHQTSRLHNRPHPLDSAHWNIR